MGLKLNLGCGNDVKKGYLNVDYFVENSLIQKTDLSLFPWPWEDGTVDEILMLDFLEHFPYGDTNAILSEASRILKIGGCAIIQVPDFEHCAYAMLDIGHFLCNVCGNSGRDYVIKDGDKACAECSTPFTQISEAAMNRLFGGQDREGNFHYAAFTANTLAKKLAAHGFGEFELLEKHHQWKNWNFKLKAEKVRNDGW